MSDDDKLRELAKETGAKIARRPQKDLPSAKFTAHGVSVVLRYRPSRVKSWQIEWSNEEEALLAPSYDSIDVAAKEFKRLLWVIGEYPDGRSYPLQKHKLSFRDMVLFTNAKPRVVKISHPFLVATFWGDTISAVDVESRDDQRVGGFRGTTRKGVPYALLIMDTDPVFNW